MMTAHSRATRDQALALAEEVGPAEAARRLGIKLNTVKGWRRRYGGPAGAAAPAEPRSRAKTLDPRARWEQRLELLLTEADRLTREGKHEDARKVTISAGIAQDKLLLLSREPASGELDDEARSEAQALFDDLTARARAKGVVIPEPVSRVFSTLMADPPSEPDLLAKYTPEQKALVRYQVDLIRGVMDGLLGDLDLRDSKVALTRVVWWLDHARGKPKPEPLTADEAAKLRRLLAQKWDLVVPSTRTPAGGGVPVSVPVEVRPVETQEAEDEPAEAEVVTDAVRVVPRPRALPRAGTSAFAANSIQARIGGWRNDG